MGMNDTTLGLLSGGIVVFVVVCAAVIIVKRTLRRRRKRDAIRYGTTTTLHCHRVPDRGGPRPKYWGGG